MQLPKRLLSIDVVRAITMLLMIFVNDASGVSNIPEWIDHVKAADDGLGFADTIFPAFLFIVGLSIPFAIRNRISKGDSFTALTWYIITRSFALLVMGFYHVNGESYNYADAILPHSIWEILITVAFFMIWLDYPKDLGKMKKYIIQGAGVVLLLLMAYLYKGGKAGDPHGMTPHWWGILGIIGWSYLVCALVYHLSKGKTPVLIAFWVVFVAINILSHTGHRLNIPVIGDASSVSLTMGGIVASVMYVYLAGRDNQKLLWIAFLIAGIALILGGLWIRPYTEGISKIRSTPSWVFICSGITLLLFELMIYLVDLKGKADWFKIIKPAGTITLTCYLIPYLLYPLMNLVHFHFPEFLDSGIGGIIRSFAIAFIVIGIAGALNKIHIRLKV